MIGKGYRQSIRFRFLSIISLILLLGTLVFSIVIAVSERSTLERSLETKGQSLASFIGKMSEDPLLLRDALRLDAIVNDANKDEDVLFTFIRDSSGALLTSQYASINFRSPLIKTILRDHPRDAELPAILSAVTRKLAVTELTVPIQIDVRTIGTVTIGMSKDRIRMQVVKTVVFVLLLNLAVAAALGTVLFVTSQKILLTPIAELAHAASRLARGELSTQVSVKTTGEVSMLVDSFNQMAGNLERTTVSRDYMDNIINSMMDSLIVVSPQGAIVRANRAACLLLGYREQELVGLPAGSVILADLTGESDALAYVRSQGSVSTVERAYRAKDGRTIPVLFSASVMRDRSGAVQGIVCAAQDITGRKRAEAQLQAYSAELAQINEELKNFAYIVSHDLRAPLVNIKGFSQELARSLQAIEPCFQKHLPLLDPADRDQIAPLLQKEIPEALQFIGSSVIRMDSLINAVLKLSRAGRRRLSLEPVRVRDLVQESLDTHAHQISSRQIGVTLGDLPDLVSDRASVEQIFANLLDNAIKYLDPARPGLIAVTAERSDGDFLFRISDNGRGMAQEDIPRAFEMFRRVGRQDVPGEGIGLAYVKTLVRLLGGRIWCDSEPGIGSTFSFSLPSIDTTRP